MLELPASEQGVEDCHQGWEVLVENLQWIGSAAHTDTLADAGGWVAFAPDGSQFAALQLNGIGLWDGHTGDYQGSLPIPALATGASIRYLPDSTGLLIAARDGRTWTADTRTDTWPERACTIAGRNLTQSGVDEVLPQPALPRHLPRVARWLVTRDPGSR